MVLQINAQLWFYKEKENGNIFLQQLQQEPDFM